MLAVRKAAQALKRAGQPAVGRVRQRVGAGVAVLRTGEARTGEGRREVLLVRRRDDGLWDLPGGGVNVGEEVEAAARRELREETGLEAGALTLLGVFSGDAHRHTYPDGNEVAWVTALYTAHGVSGDARAGDDAGEAAWWPLEALPQNVSAATRAYFAALIGGEDGA